VISFELDELPPSRLERCEIGCAAIICTRCVRRDASRHIDKPIRLMQMFAWVVDQYGNLIVTAASAVSKPISPELGAAAAVAATTLIIEYIPCAKLFPPEGCDL
jgi:hypothetical protein